MGKRGPARTTADAKKHIGNIEIQKGQTKGGIPVVAWDAIPQCDEDSCRIADVCPYEHAGKCRVRKEYISYVHKILMGQVNPKDTMAVFNIGMQLIPLFCQLIDIKIATYGTRVTYVNNHGTINVNPALREMRACLKSINDCLNSLKEAFDGAPKGTDALVGDDSWYDSLFHGETEEEEFKMRNRV